MAGARVRSRPVLADIHGDGNCIMHMGGGVFAPAGPHVEVEWLQAPAPVTSWLGLKAGHRLKILKVSVTPSECPDGAGLTCFELERGVRVVLTGEDVKWFLYAC